MVVRYTFSSSAHIFDILVNRYEIKMLSADDLHTSSVAINKTQYTNAWTRIESAVGLVAATEMDVQSKFKPSAISLSI